MRVLLVLVLLSPFVELPLPPAPACEAPGALACAALGPHDGALRLEAPAGARFVFEDAQGAPLAEGMVDARAFVEVPPGAARVVVRAHSPTASMR